MNYKDYINSEEWHNKRKEFLQSKYFFGCCTFCRKKPKQYEIHHKTYKNLGRENIAIDLVALCKKCHDLVHDQKEDNIWVATEKIQKRFNRRFGKHKISEPKRTIFQIMFSWSKS